MIVGIGIDVVDVARFAGAVDRTPRLLERVFTDDERAVRRSDRLAARFAAKEALAKALGAPTGLHWHDAEVVTEPSGTPRLVLRGGVAAAADARGARSWQLSLTHDAGVAAAFVVLES